MKARSSGRARLGVLISGRGSNLQSIIDSIAAGDVDASIALVVSDRADAAGLKRARDAGIETVHLNPRDHADRDAYDRAIAALLRSREVTLVCLAGYMRLVHQPLLDAFPQRILNIHPSLLPAFPGLDTHARALAAGVKLHGCSVHFATTELDHGPIVIQAAVPVRPDDTGETLAARVLRQEHVVYPRAVRWFLDGKLVIKSGVVCVKGNDAQLVLAPD